MTDHEILVKARNIQAGGLCKGTLADGPKRCMYGSINEAITGNPYMWHHAPERHEHLTEAVRKANGWQPGTYLNYQNNHPLTTLDDVLGWFDKAIAYTAPPPEDPPIEPPTAVHDLALVG